MKENLLKCSKKVGQPFVAGDVVTGSVLVSCCTLVITFDVG